MQSGQPGHNDQFDRIEPDISAATIPDFARAWESALASSVRRPSILPDPELYHKAIEPQAIFALDEKQEDGSITTILVVPFGCERCKTSKQACSRTQPACVRCRRAGLSCEVVRGGYQRLPGPKFGRPSLLKKQSTSRTCENSKDSSSAPQKPLAGRSLSIRQIPPLLQVTRSNSERSVVTRSKKRPPSPRSDPVSPRKKKKTKTTSRDAKARPSHTVVASAEMDTECSEASVVGPSAQMAPAAISAGERSILKWTFVNNSRRRGEKTSPGQKYLNSIPSNTPVPRVWTNSLNGLLTVFPELAKTPVGFSWFQSETPILLLDKNYDNGRWINSTTLSIDLFWKFSCHDFELESIVKSDTVGSTQLHSCQPVVPSPESAPDHEADTMGLRNSHLPPQTGLFPTRVASQPTFSARILPSDATPQNERCTCQGTCEYYVRGRSPSHTATPNDSVSTVHSTQLYPSHPLPPAENPPPFNPCSAFDGSLTHHTTFQATFQPRIPFNKPPEVETLLNSHLRLIPLLLWIPHDSGLAPCNLPPEYAFSCMGLFFISDLRHTVIQHDVSSTTGVIQGRVCWSVTFQWAPGGEEELFDCNRAPSSDVTSDSAQLDTTRDLLHPWWFDPTDTSSQADNTAPYRPRDLRMHFVSFIPLDLLADFHPSESFPRGWFCKSCGMINIQEFFRHQICQSTMCGSTRERRVPRGKADSLSNLRDPYQSSTFIRPTINIPSVVVSDSITWDDEMQSWIYGVRDGVVLCHVFTGNQEHLQEDATALLEKIQCEALLRRKDPSSPYFTHTTRLSHLSDGSDATVPGGTPDCVRIAYYTLCDFVHRYGEMDKPRFGEVRMQAWVNSGSKKGSVFRASKSPIAVHCLGADVILNFTPMGGYKDPVESIAPDKDKGSAKDKDRMGSPPTKPRPGLEQDSGNQASFIPRPSANEPPIVAEHVDEATSAMDTVHQCRSLDAGGISASNHIGPGMEMARHEVVEPKQGGVRKKNKVIKDKSKASVPEISMTLVHGDCVVLYGDDFECQIVRTGTTILVTGFPEDI
ncbi:hypothetical protein J3R82DRAFT_2755 [Butyriboletus roseoflavus]|nr:hypothetical protein J3R82DRAFT_2755 [Butyriboletus roseoflavus]